MYVCVFAFDCVDGDSGVGGDGDAGNIIDRETAAAYD